MKKMYRCTIFLVVAISQISSIWGQTPTKSPTNSPTKSPTSKPSSAPSDVPSRSPSEAPSRSLSPSAVPSRRPSRSPSDVPSRSPSDVPSRRPSRSPSDAPSRSPSDVPSRRPSRSPSDVPSRSPSDVPSRSPSDIPSRSPSDLPSRSPSDVPSHSPSDVPSRSPSDVPSRSPSDVPSRTPSRAPSDVPSLAPSPSPSALPSSSPSESPSSQPSESPSTNPSRSCENLRPDCGYGLFNPWTCECDCAIGICYDSNRMCHVRCDDTIGTNPFAGCTPGWDCPWYPDRATSTCKSQVYPVEVYEIYRTAQDCCDAEYASSASCVTQSKANHQMNPGYKGSKKYYYPSLSNLNNCVRGNSYDEWMTADGYAEYYLFDDAGDCCSMWYPDRTDCPNGDGEVSNRWVSLWRNYYFPDFENDSCSLGRNYPAWMGRDGFDKWYLWDDPADCCSHFFPGRTDCPKDTTPEIDYYWTSYREHFPNDYVEPPIINETYYPDINGHTCIIGFDYPAWMGADETYKHLYLYHDAESCCGFWFGADITSCVADIINSTAAAEEISGLLSDPTNNTAQLLGRWYPNLDERKCLNDGNTPSFMIQKGYSQWYLFTTHEGCCGTFDCSGE